MLKCNCHKVINVVIHKTTNLEMAGLLNVLIEDEEPAERVYRPRINPLTEYTDVEFCKRYRLPKVAVLHLAQTMKNLGFRGPLHGDPDKRTLSAVLTVSHCVLLLLSPPPLV